MPRTKNFPITQDGSSFLAFAAVKKQKNSASSTTVMLVLRTSNLIAVQWAARCQRMAIGTLMGVVHTKAHNANPTFTSHYHIQIGGIFMKLIRSDVIQSQLKSLCEKYNITYGGEYDSFGKALAEFTDKLPAARRSVPGIESSQNQSDYPELLNSSAKVVSPKGSIRIEPKWEKTRYGYWAWTCRYGNIITYSKINPENCIHNHLKKLKNLGIDISRFKT